MTEMAQSKVVLPASSQAADHSEGMSYLETVPRRLVTVYLPLSIIVIVLLFPFYWMALTAIGRAAAQSGKVQPVLDLDADAIIKHIEKLLFETNYPLWLWNTMLVAVSATVLSIAASVLAAYAIVRLRYRGSQWVGAATLSRLPGPALNPVHPAVNRRRSAKLTTACRFRRRYFLF